MRFVLAALCALMLSSPVSAGGMSGGTGIGGLIQMIADSLEKFLKLPVDDMDPNAIRRILMRLAVCGEAVVQVGDQTVLIKYKYDQWAEGIKAIEVTLLPESKTSIKAPTPQECKRPSFEP